MMDWCRDNYRTVTLPKLEADDVMGIKSNSTTIIVSDDKDMKTIPTRVFRPTTGESLNITKEEADKNFFIQALTGDATDGYKGLSGVGIKKAEAILGARPHWGAVEDAYVKAGYTKEEALTQARLARILRTQDWDYEKREVKLWTP
jgi:DNA polymerase-1